MEAYIWWLIAGVILILAEFVVPGVFICFFGVGALLTGVATLIFPTTPLAWALLIFTILSLISLFTCRRFMPKTFRGVSKVDNSDIENDDVVGAEVTVVEPVAPDAPGKVEFRGSLWTASADHQIAAGEHAKVIRRQNLTLFLG